MRSVVADKLDNINNTHLKLLNYINTLNNKLDKISVILDAQKQRR